MVASHTAMSSGESSIGSRGIHVPQEGACLSAQDYQAYFLAGSRHGENDLDTKTAMDFRAQLGAGGQVSTL